MKILRNALLVAIVLGAVLFTGDAAAQIACNDCDPWSTPCSTACWYCVRPGIDECQEYGESTCGQSGPCIQDNCTPNWVVTSVVNQGTYGVGYSWYCEHHTVDKVTESDTNQCSTSSIGWTKVTCEDDVDGYKYAFPSWPDCCDGSPGFSCNHYHHCY
jgi:hypothetical protein